jgi:hypothetical protein
MPTALETSRTLLLFWTTFTVEEPSLRASRAEIWTTAVDLTDPVFLLNALFAGRPQPVEPFTECGSGPTIDELTCESFGGCR